MSTVTSRPPAPRASPSAALVLYSGGQDSAVCLTWALQRYDRVETVGFDYGQRHRVELEARLVLRQRLAERFATLAKPLGPDHLLDLTSFGQIAETSLTSERKIEITERGLPSTFVPGRNLVFLTYAAALADRRGLSDLVGGMGEADYSGYPDCRQSTLQALETALRLGMERDLSIITPLMELSKADIWAMAYSIGGEALVELIAEDSHTCYLGERSQRRPWGYGCGDCPACLLRAKGWFDWRARQGRTA